jgi:hypothetical protein
LKVLFLLFVAAATAVAQQDAAADLGSSRRITAASEFFDHDYVNVYAFANGVWDSRVPLLSGNSSFSGGLGWEAGGGLTLTHSFKGGSVTLNYRGSYRDYQSAGFTGGDQQSLAFAFDKRLSRRWGIGGSVGAGIVSYGASTFSAGAVGSDIATNPFSTQSRYVNSGVTLSFQQSRRLSYVFSGEYLLSSYNYVGALNSHGYGGGASVLYRVTARTTMGLNYNHTNFAYSHNAGNSAIDTAGLSLSHQFNGHWQLDLSGGVSRVHSKGVIQIPVSLILDGQTVTGYYNGAYNRTLYSPSFQGTLSRNFRRSILSIGGGQSVLGGNGIYLTSRNQTASVLYSYSTRRQNFGVGATYSRLSSVANSVSQTYATDGASASYGVNLVRYVSANFRYDFLHYDGLFVFSGLSESRVSFGLSLSSKSVPLTLF